MQRELDLVLGKDAVASLADEIIVILDEELVGVEDKPDRLRRIAHRLADAIDDAGNNKEG